MREIRFRVWNAETNQMSYDRYCLADPTGRMVFLQYTGLQDKNGVEIYEGDIARNTSANQVEPFHRPSVSQVLVVENKGKWGYPLFQGIHEKLWEVIGNIYENPELIGENK